MHAFLFFFSLSRSLPVLLCCSPPPLTPLHHHQHHHQTLLMDPMSAEYQSKPHNCTVASCLSLPQRLSLSLSLSLLRMKKHEREKWIEKLLAEKKNKKRFQWDSTDFMKLCLIFQVYSLTGAHTLLHAGQRTFVMCEIPLRSVLLFDEIFNQCLMIKSRRGGVHILHWGFFFCWSLCFLCPCSHGSYH